MLYLTLKAAHVVSVMTFIGGLLAQSLAVRSIGDGTCQLHHQIELWDRRVTTPAMLATWLFGIIIAVNAGFLPSGWLIAKLTVVIALSGLHGVQAGVLRRSLAGRLANMGTLHSIAPIFVVGAVCVIATLVVAKPF